MAGDYAVFAGETVGGGPLRLYFPAARTDYPQWFLRFGCAAPAGETLALNEAILCNGRDWACLYDAAGHRIDATALTRFDEEGAPHLWRAAPTLPSLTAYPTLSLPVVYQSILFNHWGHFLLESVARLGPKLADPALAALPAIYTWMPQRRLPAIEAFLAALDQPLALYEPDAARIRLKTCFAPPAAFAHEGYADPRHLIAPHAVARRLLIGEERSHRPVYLSRAEVAGAVPGRAPLRNEAELEAELVSCGARVVHMQRLTLAEQVAVMNAHRVFIGLWGSALHNTLFALRGPEIATFVLIDDARRPANFRLVDRLVGNAAHYLNVVHDDGDGGLRIDVSAAMAYLREAGAL